MDIFPRSSQLWKQTNNMIPFDRLGAKFRGERVGIAQPLRSLRSRLPEINSILYNQVEISGKNLTWQLCMLYLFPIPPARHSPPLQRLSGTPWNLLWWPMQGLRLQRMAHRHVLPCTSDSGRNFHLWNLWTSYCSRRESYTFHSNLQESTWIGWSSRMASFEHWVPQHVMVYHHVPHWSCYLGYTRCSEKFIYYLGSKVSPWSPHYIQSYRCFSHEILDYKPYLIHLNPINPLYFSLYPIINPN